jgi:hypothetical protein
MYFTEARKRDIPVRVLNIAFDFCFRRVTEEGYDTAFA